VYLNGRIAPVSDDKPVPVGVKLLDESIFDLARKIGEMDLDDPTRAELIKELCGLGQLRASLKSERDKLINQRMDRLAREVGTLKPDDPRRAQLVSQILRLKDLLSAK
jgi:hypothetical protein